MDIPEIELVLSRDISGIIHEYLGITKQFVRKIEKKLFEMFNCPFILLIGLESGSNPLGLFTTKEKAINYMIRCHINDFFDNGVEVDRKTLYDQNKDINEYYRLILVYDIDITKPIYVNQDRNRNVELDNTFCLTNSLEYFKKHNLQYKKYKQDEWIEKCILQVNPKKDCIRLPD